MNEQNERITLTWRRRPTSRRIFYLTSCCCCHRLLCWITRFVYVLRTWFYKCVYGVVQKMDSLQFTMLQYIRSVVICYFILNYLRSCAALCIDYIDITELILKSNIYTTASFALTHISDTYVFIFRLQVLIARWEHTLYFENTAIHYYST